jgi:hypothetical protein
MSCFKLAFGRPTYWWIPVDLWFMGQIHSFKASGVLNDPIYEAAAGTLELLTDNAPLEIGWWREPKWNSLWIEPMLDGETVDITLYVDHEIDKTTTATQVITSRSTKRQVCMAIASALLALSRDVDEDDYQSREGWSRVFPTREVRELERLMFSPIQQRG